MKRTNRDVIIIYLVTLRFVRDSESKTRLVAFIFSIMLAMLTVIAVSDIPTSGTAGNFITSKGRFWIAPKGEIVREERAIPGNFSAIQVNASIPVDVKLSDKNLVVIEARKDMMPFIYAHLSGVCGTSLWIGQYREPWVNAQEIRITVYCQQLPEAFYTSGGAHLTIDGPIKAETLTLGAYGTSNISIKELECEELTIRLFGASSMDIAGSATSVTGILWGMTRLRASELEVNRVAIQMSKDSRVRFGYIHEELFVDSPDSFSRLPDSNALDYRGTPTVTKR